MQKKYLSLVVVLLGITFVSAVAVYFYLVHVNLQVHESIEVTGSQTQDIGCYSGEVDPRELPDWCLGDSIDIHNHAQGQREVFITDNAIEDIDVSYVAEIDLDYGNNTNNGEFYGSIFGDNFSYKLYANSIADGDYYLIYFFGDFGDWENASAFLLGEKEVVAGEIFMSGEIETGNLNGKILLMPSSDYDTSLQKITSWNPQNYIFGSDDITYFDNTENSYILPASESIEIYPLIEVSRYTEPSMYSFDITIS